MKILLAEDDAVTRRLITEALRREGHDVTAVADGEAALRAFAESPSEMLIVDWEMPKVDGLTLCNRIRETEAGRHAFLLMVTGRDSVADLAMAMAAGVDDYVVKPVADQLQFRVMIAERRLQADTARRVAEAQLEDARWKSGVSEAIVAMQHEINNPLAALLATLELAADDSAPPEEYKPAITTALAQTHRIVAVMRRIAAIRKHRSVEYVDGVPMLEIPPLANGDG